PVNIVSTIGAASSRTSSVTRSTAFALRFRNGSGYLRTRRRSGMETSLRLAFGEAGAIRDGSLGRVGHALRLLDRIGPCEPARVARLRVRAEDDLPRAAGAEVHRERAAEARALDEGLERDGRARGIDDGHDLRGE